MQNKMSRTTKYVQSVLFASTLAIYCHVGLAARQAESHSEELSLAFIEIEGTPLEIDDGYTWLGGGSETLLGLVQTIDTLAYDREFGGIVIRLKDAYFGMTQVEEIGQAIERYKRTGKEVHVFAEGYSTNGLAIASFADQVILQSGGYVSFPGMHMEEMYLADTYSWIGMEAQLVQVGDYKGANETATRSSPSPQWNENIESLLDGLYANTRSVIMDGRDLDDEELDEAMEVIWSANGKQAIEAGVIDFEVDLPNLRAHFEDYYNTDVHWVLNPYEVNDAFEGSITSVLDLFGGIGESAESINIDHPTIAVLHINGTIIDGESTTGGLFGGGSSVGSRTIRNAIESIRKNDLIRGVVVRVNSPGGSAIASEVMWQGLDQLSDEKPVWVSVGSMAASGGYYVLSAGDRVFVNPSSIVGSIGVVGGKYTMTDLYQKAKINVVERSRGPMGGMYSTNKPWTPTQVEIVREQMKRTYDLFTDRVRAGRDGIDLEETAEGRLFVGRDAIKLNMADDIGGLDDAVNTLAGEIDLGDFDVVHFPRPHSFEEMLLETLEQYLEAPGVMHSKMATAPYEHMIRSLLGEDTYSQIIDSLNAMALLRDEHVLLINPRVLNIR